MFLLAVAVAAAVIAVGATYRGFLRFRDRARAHLLRHPDVEWRGSTATGMICAVLGYPLEVDLITTYVYRWRRRADEGTLFDELAAALRSRVPPIEPPPFPLVRDRILPLIRRTDAVPPQGGYRSENRLLRRPFDAGLSVVYVIEGQFRRTYVTEGMVAEWNTDPAAVHGLAVSNLGARTRHVLAEIGGRRHEYVALDGYDAARILVADLIVPDGLTDPVIGIPDEHACLIADRPRETDLAARVAEIFRTAQAPLTTRLFRLAPDGIVPALESRHSSENAPRRSQNAESPEARANEGSRDP